MQNPYVFLYVSIFSYTFLYFSVAHIGVHLVLKGTWWFPNNCPVAFKWPGIEVGMRKKERREESEQNTRGNTMQIPANLFAKVQIVVTFLFFLENFGSKQLSSIA